MNETQLKTVAQVMPLSQWYAGGRVQPIGEDSLRYEHIAAVLRRLGYRRLKRPDKGVVLRYLERTTGYSRQQLTRLVRRGLDGEVLDEHHAQAVMALELAVIQRRESGDYLQERRLAGSIAADEADALAFQHREAGAIEQRMQSVSELRVEEGEERP